MKRNHLPILPVRLLRFARGTRHYKKHSRQVYPTYETATNKNAKRFSRGFLESFKIQNFKKRKNSFSIIVDSAKWESFNSISLINQKTQEIVGQVKIGFEENAIVVEAIQGRSGKKREVDAFKNFVNQPWANYLLTCLEEHARELGFKKVKIRMPETLEFYLSPIVVTHGIEPLDSIFSSEVRRIRKNISDLYYSVAKNLRYKIRFPFFIKKL